MVTEKEREKKNTKEELEVRENGPEERKEKKERRREEWS